MFLTSFIQSIIQSTYAKVAESHFAPARARILALDRMNTDKELCARLTRDPFVPVDVREHACCYVDGSPAITMLVLDPNVPAKVRAQAVLTLGEGSPLYKKLVLDPNVPDEVREVAVYELREEAEFLEGVTMDPSYPITVRVAAIISLPPDSRVVQDLAFGHDVPITLQTWAAWRIQDVDHPHWW